MLTSELAARPGEQYPLDRIRMQKAVFLLTVRGSTNWATLYKYKPYNWGPYSSQLASDINLLVTQGQMEVEDVPGSQHGAYRLTAPGEARAREIWAAMTSREESFVTSVRAYVTHRSFTQLLREVYAEYPEFASASYFSG